MSNKEMKERRKAKMKFYILNKSGDTALEVDEKNAAAEFDRLTKEGYYALDKEGNRVEEVPETFEDLVFGKEIKDTGRRGD